MENNNYLNKALKDAAATMKIVQAQQEQFQKLLPELKRHARSQGADMTIIEKMEKAAQNKDLAELTRLSNQLNK